MHLNGWKMNFAADGLANVKTMATVDGLTESWSFHKIRSTACLTCSLKRIPKFDNLHSSRNTISIDHQKKIENEHANGLKDDND